MESWDRKEGVTQAYVEWFVTQQSGDAKLAERLTEDWKRGWNTALEGFRAGKSSEQVAETLTADGHNVVFATRGLSQFKLPGRTVSFLVMDRENCCEQITLERWTAETDDTTSIVLTGMGQKDIDRSDLAEKQIHLCAIELPANRDYLEFRTQSISPILKGIIVFTAAALLTGCDSKPATPPTPHEPPSDPTGAPGDHEVTTSLGEGDPAGAPTDIPAPPPEPAGPAPGGQPEPEQRGVLLPTGRDQAGKVELAPHTSVGVKTNISPDTPANQWHWFYLHFVNVKRFQPGCCFHLEVQKSVWLNSGNPIVLPWEPDTPLPGNIWIDGDGLHLLDTPGYPSNEPQPPPYQQSDGLGRFVTKDDHMIVTFFFRLFFWCPGDQEGTIYRYSVTMEIRQGVQTSHSERPRQTGKRAVTADDERKKTCPS